MKRFFLSIICVMSVVCMQAQSYNYLTFQSNTGEKSVTALGTVITFSSGNMVVKNAEEEYTVALSELNKFYFSETSSAIKSVANDADEPMTVYTVSGQLVGRFANKSEAQSQLPRGIYVTKGKSESKKMMVE